MTNNGAFWHLGRLYRDHRRRGSRRIPNFLVCRRNSVPIFWGGAMVDRQTLLIRLRLACPRPARGFFWAVVVWLLQPGMVLDLSRLPVRPLRTVSQRASMRRGVMQIAIP